MQKLLSWHRLALIAQVNQVQQKCPANAGVQRSKRVEPGGRLAPSRKSLLRDDVLGLRTFLAVCDRELDLLAVGQGFEAITLNCAEVDKNVRPIFLSDKAVPFGFVKPLHGARNC